MIEERTWVLSNAHCSGRRYPPVPRMAFSHHQDPLDDEASPLYPAGLKSFFLEECQARKFRSCNFRGLQIQICIVPLIFFSEASPPLPPVRTVQPAAKRTTAPTPEQGGSSSASSVGDSTSCHPTITTLWPAYKLPPNKHPALCSELQKILVELLKMFLEASALCAGLCFTALPVRGTQQILLWFPW